PPPSSTLFPYTTLFRSVRPVAFSAPEERLLTQRYPALLPRDAVRGRGEPLQRAKQPLNSAGSHAGNSGRESSDPEPLHPALSSRSEEHTSELQSPYDLV